ncbi:hypothetical protein OIO90_003573 [Microbotryomycetes sp. JL221]|nr:hypothetical protein OIO90_003573 [Microbotryomycetes sp. JL221]
MARDLENNSVMSPRGVNDEQSKAAFGTVSLISANDKKDIVLIPAPSADPRDPLNMKTWHKWVCAIILSLYSCTGLTVVSAAGSLISFFLQDYIEAGKGYQDIVRLITIPTLSMGVSNFLFMPVALAIGRRPVYIGSCVILVVACIVASFNTSYEYHLACRIIIGFAAGQSEALVPLMLKEMFFIHERANILAFQSSFQGIIGCILTLFSAQIAAGVGWKRWYLLYGCISIVILVASIIFVPETKFARPAEAYNGLTATTPAARGYPQEDKESTEYVEDKQVTVSTRPALDTVNHKPRTILSDMSLFSAEISWGEAWGVIKHMCQMILFPNVLLVILGNSWFLGINIAQGTTYATVLEAPPHNWAPSAAGYAQGGQIVVAFILLPMVGFGSDWLIKFMARRNNGIHEPEVRLIPLAVPVIVGTMSTVLFGYAYARPFEFHWFAIVFCLAANYFAFIAASVAGLVSFGLTYSLTPTTTKMGYIGAYGMYAGVMSFFGLAGFALFFFGRRLRLWTLQFVASGSEDGAKPRYG